MQHFLQFIGSFFIALAILSTISIAMSEYNILDPAEQTQLKNDKTYWKWEHSPNASYDIHYIEKGSGPHVILIHGFRQNTYTWRHLIDPLAEAGFHVWAIDLIGYGFSDKPDIEYHLDLFSQQVQDFISSKNIDQAHLIGGSMGGGISLSFAVGQPENVLSLILIDALGYPLDLPLYISIGKHLPLFWGPFLGTSMIRKGLEQLVFQPDTVTDEQVYAYTLPYYFPGGASAALSTLKNFDNQKLEILSKNYKKITCPLLVIWGEHDTLIPLEHYERFCQDFSHAQTRLIHNCGHIPQEERPDEVLKDIIFFLKSISNRIDPKF